MQSFLTVRRECTPFQIESARSATRANISQYPGLTSANRVHSVLRCCFKRVPPRPAKHLPLKARKPSLLVLSARRVSPDLFLLGLKQANRSNQVPAKSIAEIRELAESQHGRDGNNIKVLALVTPIIGRTEEEAQAKLADYRKYASLDGALALFCGWTGIDLGKYGDDEELREVESNAVRSTVEAYARFSPGTSKWTKHTVAEHVSIGGNGPIIVGTPAQVVDGLQTWVDEADVDGFNFAYALFPQSFKDIIELLLPELRARGLFWDDYAVPGGTYRENFYGKPGQKGPLDEHVASTYRWKAGVDAKDHVIPE
jgi:Luciferase-like monooxygenase